MNNNNNWDQFQSTPKLLPPTVFERSTLHDNTISNHPTGSNNLHNNSHLTSVAENNENMSQFSLLSNELEKMKHEIKKVHSENENLRLKNTDFVEQAQLYSEASGHRKISITALEDIIHKQTREIQSLKSDLLTEKENSSNRFKSIETEWIQKKNDSIAQLNNADLERKKIIEKYENTILKTQNDHELINKKQLEKIDSLTAENRMIKECYDKEIVELKKTADSFNSIQLVEASEKDEQIKFLTIKNQKYETELENLKNYVNNSMPTIETVKEKNKEIEVLNKEIQKINVKNENLCKENDSIQIRLKSMNEILSIQENQLESKAAASTSSTIYNEKKRQGLLGRWRNKVYELLVKLKSHEITGKQDKNMAEKTLQDYLDRLEDAINKNKIFENVIADKKAELSVIAIDNSILVEQVSVLKVTNANLEKNSDMDLQSSLELKNFVDSLMKQYQTIEDSFKVANKKLIHLDQRVEFAKNRLGVVKALYSRKEMQEVKRSNVLEMTTNLSSIHGSMDPNESNFNPPISIEHEIELPKIIINNEEENILRRELEVVVEDRNLLARKLQEDIELMDKKEANIKMEYEKKVINLEKQIKELNDMDITKQEKIGLINEQLISKTNLHADLIKKYEETQQELIQIREKLILDYEKQLKKKDLDYAEKISKMDDKLNEARREQAKAVVIMRQMERSTNREKDRMENLLKSCDTYYKEHLDKLQNKIILLEKERNVLMNTLRQQDGDLSNQQFNSIIDLNNSYSHTNNIEKSSFDLEKSTSSLKNNDTTEVTSFWVDDQKQKSQEQDRINEECEEDTKCSQNEEEEMTEELNESDMHKNSEILQQIRKIMGNLELSDLEDDLEDEQSKNKQNKDDDDEETDENYIKDYPAYESEHSIDEESSYQT